MKLSAIWTNRVGDASAIGSPSSSAEVGGLHVIVGERPLATEDSGDELPDADAGLPDLVNKAAKLTGLKRLDLDFTRDDDRPVGRDHTLDLLD